MSAELENAQQRLQALWQGRDLSQVATPAAARMLDEVGEWDPPKGVEPLREPLNLSVGIPDSATLPRAALAAAMNRVLAREDDAHLRYGFGEGYFLIRQYLTAKYGRERGGFAVSEDWFQLTYGAAGAIDLVVRSLIEPGDVILVEAPTYMGTLRNFRGVQADIQAVGIDRDGLDVDALAERLRELQRAGRRVKLIYTISTFHNPTSFTLSLARRLRLLELAADHGALILEDDVYGDLWYDAEPPPRLGALARGHGVITVSSFSKILATGLRVGWIHAHPDFIKLFSRMRFAMGQNQMALRMMGHFLAEGQLERHADQMRGVYREKMLRIAQVLEQRAGPYLSFQRPAGGFYLWAELKPPLTARALWRTGLHEGVQITPGYALFPKREDHTGEHLRIAFSWTPMDQLEQAAERLAAACARVARGDVA
jgi:DNA-binding transcriptional MocR family regulator